MKNNRLIAILLAVLFSLHLTGCSGQSSQTSESSVQNYTQVDSEKLMQYKDAYVGDNSAVVNIVTGLPGNRYEPMFSLQTKEEPYEIAINYTVNEEIEDESYLNFWNDQDTEAILEKNAIILFSLISNVDRIAFEIEGTANLSNHSYEYTRPELESTYNIDLTDFSLTVDSLNDFLNNGYPAKKGHD